MKDDKSPILQTKALSIGYKKGKAVHNVLQDIALSLIPGELVCFLGPNGVGKSTLLRTLSGVQRPLQGEVLIKQRPLSSLSLNEKAKSISLVLTGNTSGGNLSVLELVTLGRHPHTNWSGTLTTEDQKKVEEAITNTHLEVLAHRKLYTLSDGQLQKAMIARALAQDSDIMILDEPTAHLDLNNRIEIMDLLLQMTRTTQKVILAATHELDLALQTADRLWLAGFNHPIISGVSEDLILNGAIEKTFSREGIHFDPFAARFSLVHTSQEPIQLTGDKLTKQWTQYALQRLGYSVSDQEGKMHIQIKRYDEKTVWHLQDATGTAAYNSIEDLLTALKQK